MIIIFNIAYNIAHSTEALKSIKHRHNRTGILRYCSAMHKSIYIVLAQGLAQCSKIVYMYATKLAM